MATFTLPDKIDYYSVERLKIACTPKNIEKKSILVTRGREPTLKTVSKRESSKTTIQWKGIHINTEPGEDDIQGVSSLPSLRMLLTKGTRLNVLQDFVDEIKFQEGKYVLEEEVHDFADRGVISLVRSLGSAMAKKQLGKDVKLTCDQEVKLEILKQKVKAENEEYLKQHPELAILVSQIYRMIFKHKPKDPKSFIAGYVHYINTNRHKLVVLDEVDVPFDRPPPPSDEKSEMKEERQMLYQFMRSLVEECVNTATLGPAYLNVTTIIKSILKNVNPTPITSETSIQSAEEIANEIMISVLTEVIVARTNSSELVVDDVLKDVLARVHPSFLQSNEFYLGVKRSVEIFIKDLLKSITDKAIKEGKILKMLHKPKRKFEDSDSKDNNLGSYQPSKSILKVESKPFNPENVESRVTFKTTQP